MTSKIKTTSAVDLTKLNPEFLKKLELFAENEPEIAGQIIIHSGFRTTFEQGEIYKQGRTKIGRIATNADGIKIKSDHQDGNAIDFAGLDFNGNLTWGSWILFGKK